VSPVFYECARSNGSGPVGSMPATIFLPGDCGASASGKSIARTDDYLLADAEFDSAPINYILPCHWDANKLFSLIPYCYTLKMSRISP
jgi:hypothetical protein